MIDNRDVIHDNYVKAEVAFKRARMAAEQALRFCEERHIPLSTTDYDAILASANAAAAALEDARMALTAI